MYHGCPSRFGPDCEARFIRPDMYVGYIGDTSTTSDAVMFAVDSVTKFKSVKHITKPILSETRRGKLGCCVLDYFVMEICKV